MLRWFRVSLIVLVAIFLSLPAGLKVAYRGVSAIRGYPAPLLKPLVTSDLVGVTEPAIQPRFTWRTWFDGTFQAQSSQWVAQSFALRGQFVRLDNQINYSVFGKSYMANQSVIIGKANELYERVYLDEYCGIRPPIPTDDVRSTVQQMAALQARLKARGVTFVVLITPSKASIYPQYIPSAFCRSRPITMRRDYDNLIASLVEERVNHVDGPQITARAKGTVTIDVDLFSRGGTHWNALGAYFTAEDLLRKIEALTRATLPRISVDRVSVDNKPMGQDADLANLLNLWYPPTDYPTPHPVFRYEGPIGRLAKAVFVGGSFTEWILQIVHEAHAFDEIDFYYYYHTGFRRLPASARSPVDVAKIDWQNDVFRAAAIVLEINEAGLGSGEATHYGAFLKDALAQFSGHPALHPPRGARLSLATGVGARVPRPRPAP
jgi:alginate O-acetyltransferase complex protein AlgJ